jgi:hypothetical protein
MITPFQKMLKSCVSNSSWLAAKQPNLIQTSANRKAIRLRKINDLSTNRAVTIL